MSQFSREIRVFPSYDYRDEPKDQRGAHGSALVLVLRGELGVVTAEISTGWMERPLLGHYVWGREQARSDRIGVDLASSGSYPSGAYVGAHTAVPREAFNKNGPCSWLGTEFCYGDGGFLIADEVLKLLVTGGDDAAFKRLEELYRAWIVERPIVTEVGELK